MKPINKYLVNRHITKNDMYDVSEELTEGEVRSYIKDGADKYCEKVTIRSKNGKPIVDIEGDFIFRKDIDEIPFQFGKVTGNFNCESCPNLKSLKGCPEYVGGYFCCRDCMRLKSLEGCPEEVGGNFECDRCYRLKSLKGCPKKVGDDFSCCGGGAWFTERKVRSLCDVKGNIYC